MVMEGDVGCYACPSPPTQAIRLAVSHPSPRRHHHYASATDSVTSDQTQGDEGWGCDNSNSESAMEFATRTGIHHKNLERSSLNSHPPSPPSCSCQDQRFKSSRSPRDCFHLHLEILGALKISCFVHKVLKYHHACTIHEYWNDLEYMDMFIDDVRRITHG
ncbi:hypothetical protein E3N88_43441 [Mikania micrantha]|uniref:Uncharacterized protein n=1 Tax=Mikania micrantha TaxID=192012 RepID=A0A5N6LFS4_9ASTR|nr:hypothetical protein E3N88_43441 [Mikania micrantha]